MDVAEEKSEASNIQQTRDTEAEHPAHEVDSEAIDLEVLAYLTMLRSPRTKYKRAGRMIAKAVYRLRSGFANWRLSYIQFAMHSI